MKNKRQEFFSGLARLERCTRYWPMVISETILCNLMQVCGITSVFLRLPAVFVGKKLNPNWWRYFSLWWGLILATYCYFFLRCCLLIILYSFFHQLLEPLPSLIMKETITENDVLECKRVSWLFSDQWLSSSKKINTMVGGTLDMRIKKFIIKQL